MPTYFGNQGRPLVDRELVPPDNFTNLGTLDVSPGRGLRERNIDLLKFGIPGAIVGLVDTIGQSVGVLDEGEITDIVRNYGTFGKYYEQNQDNLRAAGDFLGFWVPGGLAVKAISGTAWTARALGGGRIARGLFTSGRTIDQLTRRTRRVDQLLARRGQFDFSVVPERISAASRAMRIGTIDAIKRTTAFEGGVFAFMNESDVLYPDDMTALDYIIYQAALPGAGVFVERAFVNSALRRSIRSVQSRSWDARNPAQEAVTNRFIFTPVNKQGIGGRDVGVVDLALQNYVLSRQADDALTRAPAATTQIGPFAPGRLDNIQASNLRNQIEINENLIRGQYKSLGKDNPLPRLTSPYEVSPAASRSLRLANENYPDTLLGTVSVEKAPRTFGEFLTITRRFARRVKAIDKRIEKIQIKIIPKATPDEYDKLLAEIVDLNQERDFVNGLQHHTLESDGNLVLGHLRRPTAFDNANIKPVAKRPQGPKGPVQYEIDIQSPRLGAKHFRAAVTENFSLIVGKRFDKGGNFVFGVNAGQKIPANKDRARFQMLDLFERTAVYKTYRKAIDSFNVNKSPQIIVSTDDHYAKLDAVEQLINVHGEDLIKQGKIKLPPDFAGNLDNLRMASLAGKYRDYKEITAVAAAARLPKSNKGRLILSPDLIPNIEDFRKGLNLPGTGNLQASGIIQLFENMQIQGFNNLSDIANDINELRAYTKSLVNFPEIVRTVGADEVNVIGDMLKIDPKNEPVMLVKRPLETVDYTHLALQNKTAANNLIRETQFQNSGRLGAELIQIIYNEFRNTAATAEAQRVDLLIEGTQASKGAITQQNFSTRQIAPFEAMNILEDITTRKAREWTGRLYQSPQSHLQDRSYNDIWAKLRSRGSQDDLFSFNMYEQTNRYGWDLKPTAVNRGDKWSFELATGGPQGNRNRIRFKKLFDRDWDPEVEPFMPVYVTERDKARYRPLQVTQLAYEGAISISDLGRHALLNSNHLKTIVGRRHTNFKPWWIPPRNLSRGQVRYIVTPGEELKTVIYGRTDREVEDLARQVTQQPEFRGSIAITPEQMKQHVNLQDKEFFEMIDYSDPIFQTGASRGKTSLPLVAKGDGVLNGMINGINQQFENTVRRTRAAYFEPQLNYAKQMADNVGRGRPNNIWSQYINALYGTQTINKNDPIGKIYLGLESSYDDVLNAVHDRLITKNPDTGKSISDSMRTLMKNQEKEYNYLVDKLGPDNVPFTGVEEFVEKTYNISAPPNMKIHAAKLNQFTSLLVLRFLEAGHAVLNFSSLAAVQPAVIRGMNKLKGESIKEWKIRINAFGQLHGNPADPVPQFSGIRGVASGIHFMFSQEGKSLWNRASKAGYFNQEVAELMKTLTHPAEGFSENILSRYGKWTTWLSDKSEYLSRGIAFSTGYNMARRMVGIKNDGDAMLFAHNFANKTIGDYRPNNRPRIFQGAVGMPLGLFQTFAWNYYQRLFSYIENGDIRAIATQFGMQSSIFGAQSVPGWDLFNEVFASNYDGTVNPVDGLQNRFGSNAMVDTLLYGTLSNIPRIFGADDGVALYSRGDVNFQRIPGLWALDKTPAANLIKSTYNIFDRTVAGMRQGGLSGQQMAEILATNSISRPIRNIIEMSLGERVDPRGQLIQDDVRSSLSIAARLMGLRTLTEAKQDEAYFRLRSTQFSQMEMMRDLRATTRAAIRSDGGIDEEQIRNSIHRYIQYGGNPNRTWTWLRDQYIAAKVPRAERELVDALQDPTRLYDVQRLLNAGVLSPNDPGFD